jgi:thiol-disulfide isomerase/thioredoxin
VRRRLGLLAAAGAVVLALAGCSSDSLADQYREGSGKDYIAGDGSVATYSIDSRTDPVAFSGETEDGETYDSADSLGEVVVVNFWYAQCPPCRAEARDLESIANETAPDGVGFVGVNVRDEAATAQAFNDQFGVTYPSILDYQDASVQLAFSANIPPNAMPATLILDREGRVAARILGQADPSTLRTLITETAAEAA